MTRTFRLAGTEYPMPPTTSELPSVLLVGLPKSGTTMLTKVFQMLCQETGVTHLPLHDQLYAAGIEPNRAEMDQLRQVFEPRGYCFGAFRHAFPYLSSATEMPTIWLRRDPKDVIVSRYFSQAFSHPAPGGDAKTAFDEERARMQQTEVDTFALQDLERQAKLARTYLDVIPKDELHVFWYEDIIYEKARWIAEMLEVCGWQVADDKIAAIAEAVDIIPEAENPKAFVRQVHPGNYAKHLSPQTCDRIDEYYAEHVPEWSR